MLGFNFSWMFCSFQCADTENLLSNLTLNNSYLWYYCKWHCFKFYSGYSLLVESWIFFLKIHIHSALRNVTLFESRVYADIIKNWVISYWIMMGPKSKEHVLRRDRKDTQRRSRNCSSATSQRMSRATGTGRGKEGFCFLEPSEKT